MKKSSKNFNGNRGIVLVEVLIAITIVLAFLIGLFGVHNLYLKMALSNRDVVKASLLAEEGLEVIKFLRDSSWSDLTDPPFALNTNYYLVFDDVNGVWQLSTTQSLIDSIFDRAVTLSAVYRDASSDIVSTGGTLDTDTLMVVSSVSWPNHGETSTKSISTYITNIYQN